MGHSWNACTFVSSYLTHLASREVALLVDQMTHVALALLLPKSATFSPWTWKLGATLATLPDFPGMTMERESVIVPTARKSTLIY